MKGAVVGYISAGSKEKEKLAMSIADHSRFNHLNHFNFDNDPLKILEATGYSLLYPGKNRHHIQLLTHGLVKDHLGDHMLKTSKLLNNMVENYDSVAQFAQANGQVVRPNRWFANTLQNPKSDPRKEVEKLKERNKNIDPKEFPTKWGWWTPYESSEQQVEKIIRANNKRIEELKTFKLEGRFILVRNNQRQIHDDWGLPGFYNTSIQLQEGDEIEAGDNEVEILFPDGTKIKLTKNTKIRIRYEEGISMADSLVVLSGKVERP